jgi:trehalose synthase
MTGLTEVTMPAAATEQLAVVVGPERRDNFIAAARQLSQVINGATIWNVNSTAGGGGVAEMLRSLLPWARGAGIDTRWLVIAGNPDFFAVTKRVHNHIYGLRGDEGLLGEAERATYESTLSPIAADLVDVVQPGDVVILHDPQTIGLAPALRSSGAFVLWRCHIGSDATDPLAAGAWAFLDRYLQSVPRVIVSRRSFAPPGVAPERVSVIPPSIDPFSPKNQDIPNDMVREILKHVGLEAALPSEGHPVFTRSDGSPGRVNRYADILQSGPPIPPHVPLVTQVSRWDHAKDMLGVMVGFADHVLPRTQAHLLLVGPTTLGVADDPEAGQVLGECFATWQRLSPHKRARIHLACLPMHDLEENAAIVNAIQRRSTVVVQKSLAEGFGLTAAEAMWKARPVVVSAVGGLQDQIEDGISGLVVRDPTNLEAFGTAVLQLLQDEALQRQVGKAAVERVRDRYLGDRHLERWGDVVTQVVAN